jgi:multimeric flavodoxin WrbA
MRILALSGSRNRNGNKARCIDTLQKDAVNAGAHAGAHAGTIFLTEQNLKRCVQCDQDGWGTCISEGRCIIKDGFAGIVEKISLSDVVIFATPVYFHDLSESMKTFLDHYRRINFSKLINQPPLTGLGGNVDRWRDTGHRPLLCRRERNRVRLLLSEPKKNVADLPIRYSGHGPVAAPER